MNDTKGLKEILAGRFVSLDNSQTNVLKVVKNEDMKINIIYKKDIDSDSDDQDSSSNVS